MAGLIEQAVAEKPDIIATPESFTLSGLVDPRSEEMAEEVPSPTLEMAADYARKNSTYILCPSWLAARAACISRHSCWTDAARSPAATRNATPSSRVASMRRSNSTRAPAALFLSSIRISGVSVCRFDSTLGIPAAGKRSTALSAEFELDPLKDYLARNRRPQDALRDGLPLPDLTPPYGTREQWFLDRVLEVAHPLPAPGAWLTAT
jgi:hypothetical protein